MFGLQQETEKLHWYGAVLMFVKCSARGFSLLGLYIFLPQFRPFMTGCKKRGWGLVAGQLASATLWLLCSSQSGQCSCLSVSEVDCCCAME